MTSNYCIEGFMAGIIVALLFMVIIEMYGQLFREIIGKWMVRIGKELSD